MTIHNINSRKLIEHTSILILVLLVLIICCLTSQARDVTGQVRYTPDSYRVQIGDSLGVQVYNQADLSKDSVLVRPDGYASFPGAGQVFVAGRTLDEVTTQLERQLSRLVKQPQVTMNVATMQAPVIYVSGAVTKPGRVEFSKTSGHDEGIVNGGAGSATDLRLSHVLSQAGGVRLNADLSDISILRDGQTRRVNLWPLLESGQSSGDILLKAGDSVHIPELDSMALPDAHYRLLLQSSVGPRQFPVRLLGEVEKPGVYELNGQSPYLNSAIAQAGGYTDGAKRKKVIIRRFTNEHDFAHLTINPDKLDFMLRPNDVVLVTETSVAGTARHTDIVSKALSPFTNAATAIMSYALWSGR